MNVNQRFGITMRKLEVLQRHHAAFWIVEQSQTFTVEHMDQFKW